MNRRLRFLVTGGAGFLGINLCRYLLARGHSVRSLDIAPFDYPERDRVEVISGDIRDAKSVDRAMEAVEVVVHCAAALPLCPKAEIFSTGVDGTRVLLERAMTHRIARFIFISSTAVYGLPRRCPIDESDPLEGVGPYGQSKIDAERLCRSFREQGLCVPILRPKTFVGPERLGVFELLYEWAYEGRSFPVLGPGTNRYQLLDVDDLCGAIDRCVAGDRALVDDTFNVGAAVFGTMRDNVQAVLDRAGHGKRAVSVPAMPVVWSLQALELLRLSPLYEWIYETAAKESFVSIDRIRSRLGFTPKYSNRDALERNFDWYVAHRDQYQHKSGTTHRVPWRKGALRLAKYFF